MNKKHAFLIMAHHRIDILECLLESLDFENNDIYLHLDKKCKEDFSSLKTKNAQLFFINQEDVKWGGYSQINCELNLLEQAIKKDYLYYHLLTGVSFPIKSNDYIHEFFNKNNGYEFVGFDNNGDYSSRLKYKFLFNEIGKTNTCRKKVLFYIRKSYNLIQKIFKVDRFKKYNMICKKGFVYWSITNDFAKYVVSKRNLIYTICKDSLCGDEVFLQTILYNSTFKNKIYDINDEFNSCLRICPWDSSEVGYREGYNFYSSDIDFLINSKYLFALKFEDKNSIDTVKKILSKIKK